MSIELAKKINGEIISADSMQIYKDMNIGTAKVTSEEAEGIKHYMINIESPEQRYSVASYRMQAESCIDEILKEKKVPIICGGTGLYINSLIYGIEYKEEKIDEEYRNKLNEIADTQGLEKLYKEAVKIDEQAMKKISQNDKKRIIRVLEIYHKTGKTKTYQDQESRKKELKYNYIVFAINMDRNILYDRINKRVDLMIEQGLIQEVENILKKYKSFPTAMQGLGYKEVVEYINKNIALEEMIDKIKMETRRYAKRQLTWFRKNKNTIWLDGMRPLEENLEIIIKNYREVL